MSVACIKITINFNITWITCIGRLLHIGLGFLKFSLILYNSDKKIREKVV